MYNELCQNYAIVKSLLILKHKLLLLINIIIDIGTESWEERL